MKPATKRRLICGNQLVGGGGRGADLLEFVHGSEPCDSVGHVMPPPGRGVSDLDGVGATFLMHLLDLDAASSRNLAPRLDRRCV